jgi:hypothetical protein
MVAVLFQPAGRGMVLAQGAGMAIAGACAVGVFSGVTRVQSTGVAILTGWLVGRTIQRGSSDVPAAVVAAILALTCAAAASVIAVAIRISVIAHVPFEIVVAHLAKVIPLVPRFIGALGFCCWALAALVGWWTVRGRSRPRAVSPRANAAGHAASTPSDGLDSAAGPGTHARSRELGLPSGALLAMLLAKRRWHLCERPLSRQQS